MIKPKCRRNLIIICGFGILWAHSGHALCKTNSAQKDPPTEQPTVKPEEKAADKHDEKSAEQQVSPNLDKSAPVSRENELQTLNQRIQSLEEKLNGLIEKIDATRQSMETLTSFLKKPERKLSYVTVSPSDDAGLSPAVSMSQADPEAGFFNDQAIEEFRKAMILFHAQKYPESILSFSEFISKNADHVLAGTAQYYVGQSYFNQKEFKLATNEFQRVIDNYPRSIHVTDALKSLILAEDVLNKKEEASRHRNWLSTFFPQSPAAWELKRNPVAKIAQPQEHPKEQSNEPSKPKPKEQPKEEPIKNSQAQAVPPSGLDEPPLSDFKADFKAPPTAGIPDKNGLKSE